MQTLPLTGDIRIETTSHLVQRPHEMVELAGGRFVVVWDAFVNQRLPGEPAWGRMDVASVYARLFESDGTPLGDQFPVNFDRWTTQDNSSAAALPDGGFMVAFRGVADSANGLVLRRFDADGAALSGDVVLAPGNIGATGFVPLDDGQAMLVWVRNMPGSTPNEVHGLVLNGQGAPVGQSFQIGEAREVDGFASRGTRLDNGDVMIVWTGSDDDGAGVQARILSPEGVPRSPAFDVNDATVGHQYGPAAVTLGNGSVVLAWVTNPTGFDRDIHLRRFASDGTPLGESEPLHVNRNNDQMNLALKAMPDGGFLAAWASGYTSSGGTATWRIWARRFDADGVPVGDEFIVAADQTGQPAKTLPQLLVLEDGRVVVSWSDGLSGVAMRLFAPQTVGSSADELFTAPDAPFWVDARGGNDTIIGGAHDDTLMGGDGNDVIRGEGGNDVIHGGAGNDNIGGGAGDDLIYGDDGDDVIWGGTGNDTIYGGAGNDTIHGGGNGTNQLFGGDGDDLIHAGGGGDLIDGGGGNDTIRGGIGNDTIHGGEGDDNIGGGAGNDEIHGGDGNDVIWGGLGNDTVHGGAGNDTIYGGGNGTNHLYGDDGDDVIWAGAGGDYIEGGAGNDTIRGGAGADTIHGGEGDDNIGGGAGNDEIHGGDGNDVIWGGLGNDTVHGGAGNDTIYGGGDGTNHLYGDDGDDVIWAGAGGDYIDGGAGNDTIRGGIGNDTIHGGEGDDNIGGGGGDDVIFGTAGNNVIWGGAGNDTIHSGLGRDVMNGGPGADVFVFASAAHVGIGAARDRIADFTPGVDRIDLSALNTQFNGTAGVLGGGVASFFHFAAGGLLIGDQTGNGAADWVLELPGVAALGAGDFIL